MCTALGAIGVLASIAAVSLCVSTQLDILHSCGNLRLLSPCLLCSPFSLSACYQSLASCSSLTSLSIDLPGDQPLQVDHAPLGQLTSLSKLALCYEVPTESQLKQVVVSPLSALTNLQQLVVKGFVPKGEQQPQQRQHMCLPASLTSLSLEAKQQLEEEAAEESIELWLQRAAGCNNLQQLQLINLCNGYRFAGLEKVDFGGIPHLKELRVLNAQRETSSGTLLPSSITKLTDLQVLWLGTLGSSHPWQCHFWDIELNKTLLVSLSQQCPMLRQLGPMYKCDSDLAPQPLMHLSRLALLDVVHQWSDHIRYPSLVNITVEAAADAISAGLLEQLAQLTRLTCLQLNTAFVYVEAFAVRMDEGWDNEEWDDRGVWDQIDRLAAGLSNLQRLELVNHFSEPSTPQQRFPPLNMPQLSAFPQLQQLRLACAVNHDHPLPEQLTAADLLQGLSGLTQIEQLELIGYVAVTPAVVCALIERLPKLLVLEVRSCDHPGVQVAPAGDGAEGLGAAGLSSYKEVQELYNQLRPKLRLEVLS